MQTIHWPCRVMYEKSGRYTVTPISAYACTCTADTLNAAMAAARKALRDHVNRLLAEDMPVLPPIVTFSVEELEAKRAVRLEISCICRNNTDLEDA